jgi:hypothetical protein
MKSRHAAALALVGWFLPLASVNALGPEYCVSQDQCSPQQFCGADRNSYWRASCVSSAIWPFTSTSMTSDLSTGVYGDSFVMFGGGAPPGPGIVIPEPDFSGACVKVWKVNPHASSTGHVIAQAECDKKGDFRIALPPGDYLLVGRGGSRSIRVKRGTFQWVSLAQFINTP